MSVLPALLLDWRQAPMLPTGERVGKVLAARTGILRAWQGGSAPAKLELGAALVASFLPFARYTDTDKANAALCLDVADALTVGISEEGSIL